MEDVVEEMKKLVRKALSVKKGTKSVAGLKEEVRVIWDKWGVPHVFAQNVEDLFFAEGYVHTQDRLWQMEFSRRLGSGSLAGMLGEVALDIDIFMRTVGLRRTAEAGVELFKGKCDKSVIDLAVCYVNGVNEFIETHQDNLPFEFMVIGCRPAAWTLADIFVCGELLAWQLSTNWDNEILRAELIDRLGEKRARDLLPFFPPEVSLIVPSQGHFRNMATLLLERGRKAKGFLSSDGATPGSNSWTVDGHKSVTGMPLLANDPHLLIGMPSVWYEAHLVAPGFNVIGVTLPGFPPVIIGHNERIAWGLTNLPADVQDVYVEKFDPEARHLYLYGDKWEKAEVISEKFVVRGSDEPVVKEVICTRHGPILDSIILGMASPEVSKRLGQAFALRWTGHDASLLVYSLEGLIRLNKARNWQEFRDALRLFACPPQNVIYADVEGNIGYQACGAVPIRAKGQGLVPVPGWTGEYEWIGYIPFDELPNVFNPLAHFVVTANNKIVEEDYPYLITHDWLPPYRVRRIAQLLTAKEKLSLEDFMEMQGDVSSLHAEELIRFFNRVKPENQTQEKALAYLGSWDFRMDRNSVAASLFHMWYKKLVENILKEKLGEEVFEHYFLKRLAHNCFHVLAIPKLLEYPTEYWFGNGSNSNLEKRDKTVSVSLEQAIEELTRLLGEDMAKWKWGRLHAAFFRHPLGVVPPLDQILNVGPVEVGGDEHTINQGGFDYSAGFGPVIIPSYRQIIDLGDLSKSVCIHSTGQSGQPGSEHYSDFVQSWAEVRYHPMLFEKQDIEGQARDLLILLPE